MNEEMEKGRVRERKPKNQSVYAVMKGRGDISPPEAGFGEPGGRFSSTVTGPWEVWYGLRRGPRGPGGSSLGDSAGKEVCWGLSGTAAAVEVSVVMFEAFMVSGVVAMSCPG